MLHAQYIFACEILISSRVDTTSCRLCSIVLGKLPSQFCLFSFQLREQFADS